MSLTDILHELAGRVNAPHLHEQIDALDQPEPDSAAGAAETEPEADASAGKGKGK